MKSASIAFFGLILLAACASATIVEQKVGPYDVSFDLTNLSVFLNSSASFWKDSTPASTYGIVSIVEKAHPNVEKAVIWVFIVRMAKYIVHREKLLG